MFLTLQPDIDYMLAIPEDVSPDGFAFFQAIPDYQTGAYKIPYTNWQATVLQNGGFSWINLHNNYWLDNLPTRKVIVNGEDRYLVWGMQRKLKQSVTFPTLYDPDPLKLIKTDYGQGQIEKISVSLHSRIAKVDLRYDTEPNEQP